MIARETHWEVHINCSVSNRVEYLHKMSSGFEKIWAPQAPSVVCEIAECNFHEAKNRSIWSLEAKETLYLRWENSCTQQHRSKSCCQKGLSRCQRSGMMVPGDPRGWGAFQWPLMWTYDWRANGENSKSDTGYLSGWS